MKFKNEPIFMATISCLFFPIGIGLLFKSELSKRVKLIIGFSGTVINLLLLSFAFTFTPTQINSNKFNAVATRTELSVGQSGGLAVTDGKNYINAFTVTTDSNILKLHDSTYTAAKEGTAILTVQYADQQQKIQITVNDQRPTDSTVYSSATAERYHKKQSHSGKKAVAMTEEEALQSGKTPCKICYQK